jgi:hypothetical protein
MKFDCFYKVTVTTCVPESINFFEDEEIYYWGYYPYIEVLKDVEQHYKDGADAVELEMITQEEFDLHMELEQQIITPEEFDERIQTKH